VALEDDLLEQAKHLALRESKRPRQASLRRAVSAAYYALFHLLVRASAQAMSPVTPRGLRAQVQRSFAHVDMATVCRQFAPGRIESLNDKTRRLVVAPVDSRLAAVAATFVALQQERHRADYDTAMRLDRIQVLLMIDRVQTAFAAWRAVNDSDNARVFLAALLLQRQWRE